MAGKRVKVPSLSSASTTIQSLLPNLAFVPYASITPPLTTVGSNPPPSNSALTKEVDVVFPCEPPIAIDFLNLISSANISALLTIGIFFKLAANNSTLSSFIAEDITTILILIKFLASWPIFIFTPIFLKRSIFELLAISLPVILYPRLYKTSAIPLIPIPPIPTKWMVPISLENCVIS